MATVNLGRIKPVFRGAYDNSTAYVIDDIVTSGNETFIAIAATQGNATSDASKWTKLAAKGADGTDVGTTLTTQGDILYRGASGLARLGAGASGQFLKTQGTGANPVWGTVSTGLVGFAHSVRGTSTTLNTTSYTSVHSINYTPTDYSNNRVLIFAHGEVRQDDTDGAAAYIKVVASGNHTNDIFNDVGIGVDSNVGQNFHNVSVLMEDTNLASNNQVTYTLFGKTTSSGSDFRARASLGLTIFEIGV